MNIQKSIFKLLRVCFSFIFLWAFADKTFGLGFKTTVENAWINGGSPTYGFLTHGVKGPFVEFFQSLAGMPLIDWLFMLGLLSAGILLLVRKWTRIGSFVGGMLFFLMYIAAMPPESNPLIDDHIIYILVLALIATERREK